MSSPAEAPATTLVGDWGYCPRCDAISYRSAFCDACSSQDAFSPPAPVQSVRDLWGDPNGIAQERAEQRGRQRYHVHQAKLEQKRRRKRLGLFLPTKGKGRRQLAAREVILDRAQSQYPFTAGCNETKIGTDPSNTAHVIASLEGVWLVPSGDRLPARKHLNAHGEGNQRRFPGLTGAQPQEIKGLPVARWQDLSLANETYGVRQLPRMLKKRVARALEWAIKWAEPGTRSYTGSWLIRRLVGWGLPDDQQDEIMEAWYRQLPQGGPPYTQREMAATVRSMRRCYDPAKDRQIEMRPR